MTHPQYILTAGTRAFTGMQSLGGFNLTDLLDPVAPQDAATKNYVDSVNTSMQAYVDANPPVTDHGLLSNLSGDGHPQYVLTAGTRAFTGMQSMGGYNLTDLLDPIAPQDAANKNYVDTGEYIDARPMLMPILRLPTTACSQISREMAIPNISLLMESEQLAGYLLNGFTLHHRSS